MIEKKIYVPALARGLDIFELIVENSGITFNRLVEITSLNVATLSRILNQLQGSGYIYKNQQKQYFPGYKLHTLNTSNSYISSLCKSALPIMDEIRNKYHLTLMLIFFTNQNMIVIEKTTSENNLSMMRKGSVLTDYIHFFWGLFYLKSSSPNTKKKFLAMSRDNPQFEIRPDSKLFEDYLAQADSGYITDYGNIIPHAVRFAVPVHDKNNQLIGALAAGSFNHYLKGISYETIRNVLINASKSII